MLFTHWHNHSDSKHVCRSTRQSRSPDWLPLALISWPTSSGKSWMFLITPNVLTKTRYCWTACDKAQTFTWDLSWILPCLLLTLGFNKEIQCHDHSCLCLQITRTGHQATSKTGCQPGDSKWFFRNYFICIYLQTVSWRFPMFPLAGGMGQGVKIAAYSPISTPYFDQAFHRLIVQGLWLWCICNSLVSKSTKFNSQVD